MASWVGWLYHLIDVDPEQWLWRGLCYTSLGLLLLKLGGVLALSWWWVFLPVVTPFAILTALALVILLVRLIERTT